MNILSVFMFSLCMACIVNTLPIISKPLENNPDHLYWEAPLTIDAHRSDDKTRKIPKSIFITPNLNDSKGNCPPDHKLGPDGKCYKTLKIDPLVILKTQIESLFKRNRTATTEYDDDYDYSEYGESTESMSSNSNGKYTLPLSLGFASENRQPQQTPPSFPLLNRVTKDDSHAGPTTADNFKSDDSIQIENTSKPFLVSTTGTYLGSKERTSESDHEGSTSGRITPSLLSSTTTSAISPMVIITTPDDKQSMNVEPETEAFPTTTTTTGATKTEPTINSIPNTSEQTSSESITLVENSSVREQSSTENAIIVENVSMREAIATNTETTTSESNKTVQSTTESNLRQMFTAKDLQIQHDESTTDSNTFSLPSLSQMIPEIDEILLDLSDKNPDFLGKIIIKNASEKSVEPSFRRSIIDDHSSVKPSSESNIQVNHVTEHDELSKPMTTDRYEAIEAIFVPSAFELNDSIEVDPDENMNKTFNQPRYRLENSSIISDEELLTFDSTTISDHRNDQQSDIELIIGDDSSASTDENIERNDNNESFNLRLAEESLFQESNIMMADDDHESVTKSENESSAADDSGESIDRISNGSIIFIENITSDEATTRDSIDYDTIGSSSQTEYLITTERPTEKSSIYSTFISRLRTNPTEQSTQYTNGPSDVTLLMEHSTHIDKTTVNPVTTTEPSPPLIIKKPPNHGKSLQFGINCYLNILANKPYPVICK